MQHMIQRIFTSISHAARTALVLYLGLFFIAFICNGFRRVSYRGGEAIMQSVRERHLADTEADLIRMVLIDEDGNSEKRELVSLIKSRPDGGLKYLIRLLAPEELSGVGFLSIEEPDGEARKWLYLPGLGQAHELMGEQRSGYFLGSDFTYEDLRKEDPRQHVYYRLQDDQHEGNDVYTVLSAPAGVSVQEASGYSNRILYVDKKTHDILKIEFYEPDNNQPIKIFQAYDFEEFEELSQAPKRPGRAVMSHNQNKTTTILNLRESRLGLDLSDNWFTIDGLKSWSPEDRETMLALFK